MGQLTTPEVTGCLVVRVSGFYDPIVLASFRTGGCQCVSTVTQLPVSLAHQDCPVYFVTCTLFPANNAHRTIYGDGFYFKRSAGIPKHTFKTGLVRYGTYTYTIH